MNTGYWAGQREISLPGVPAERLGLWPRLPASAVQVKVLLAGGETTVWGVRRAVRVWVVEPDRQGPAVIAAAMIHPSHDEILVSSALAGGLGLVLLDPERGLWRFRDDPPDRVRRSVRPRSW